jgi:hypothetical protein
MIAGTWFDGDSRRQPCVAKILFNLSTFFLSTSLEYSGLNMSFLRLTHAVPRKLSS